MCVCGAYDCGPAHSKAGLPQYPPLKGVFTCSLLSDLSSQFEHLSSSPPGPVGRNLNQELFEISDEEEEEDSLLQ